MKGNLISRLLVAQTSSRMGCALYSLVYSPSVYNLACINEIYNLLWEIGVKEG